MRASRHWVRGASRGAGGGGASCTAAPHLLQAQADQGGYQRDDHRLAAEQVGAGVCWGACWRWAAAHTRRGAFAGPPSCWIAVRSLCRVSGSGCKRLKWTLAPRHVAARRAACRASHLGGACWPQSLVCVSRPCQWGSGEAEAAQSVGQTRQKVRRLCDAQSSRCSRPWRTARRST